jgi:hypothetical protein
MTTPRPDQRHGATVAGASGSRSGSGDLAGALGYPGSPPAVPNCQSAQALRRGIAGSGQFFHFNQPGRIWTVFLSYTVVSRAGFAPPARFAATIQTSLNVLTLAVVQLSLSTATDHDSDTCPLSYNGLPVTGGDSIFLTVNGGLVVAGVDQEASAVVLYSIP